MAVGGQIVWNLDVDDQAFNAGLSKASNKADEFGQHVNKIDFKQIANSANQSFSNIANSIQRTATIVAGFGIATGAIFIKSAADLQQTSKSFEVLIGNASTANKLFGQIKKFADSTPFEFPELAKSAQTLLGFGRNAEQAFGDIKVLGDIAAATGADFQSLSVVFGQVNATGRLMGQDALQLINNNIPITTLLAKQLGISVQEVKQRMEDGAISTDIFNQALVNATKEGGFAFKGTEQLALTLNGRLSTLKDTVLEFGRNLLGVKVDPELGLVVQPGGLFDRFSQAIPKITASLTELAPKVVGAFDWLIAHQDLVLAILVGVAAAFIAAKIAALAFAIVALGTVGLIAGAVIITIGVLAAAAFLLIKNWDKVRTFFINLGATIVNFFTNAGNLLVDAGRSLIQGLVNGMNSFKDAVINKIKEIASGALGAIKKFFGISSPSTVMAQQGQFLMLGLAKGIQSGGRQVNSMIQNTADNMLNNFMGNSSGSLAFNVIGNTESGLSSGGSAGTVINQTNNIFNQTDLEAANRELGWRLAT